MSEVSFVAFAGTDKRLLSKAQIIRHDVFVKGQGVPVNEEVDGQDPGARHYLGLKGEEAITTARVRFDDFDSSDITAHVERVAVLDDYRGSGIGRMLMQYLIEDVRGFNVVAIDLNSQLTVKGFYESLGFEAYGPTFDEVGIAHQAMRLDLAR